jgi:hypothetical protein
MAVLRMLVIHADAFQVAFDHAYALSRLELWLRLNIPPHHLQLAPMYCCVHMTC